MVLEAVIKRLSEVGGAYSPTVPAAAATAQTVPAPTDRRSTIPAAKSSWEQEANAELAGKATHNPKKSPSQRGVKINNIKKELEKSGFIADKAKAQMVTNELPGWFDSLDPGDALVMTAKDLADKFAAENG